MSPDDPRHGTNRGYNAGCHENCCRRAQARYQNLRRMGRARSYVNNRGTIRRIHALAALGYSMTDLSNRLGFTRSYLSQILKGSSVRSDNAANIAALYDQLSMTVPNHRLARRAKRYAEKQGWVPPLAWDDIDLDDHPWTSDGEPVVDELAIERALEGKGGLSLERLEREETLRRHLAAGGTKTSFQKLTGIQANRYLTPAEEVAAA